MEQFIAWFILINVISSILLCVLKRTIKSDNCYAWVAAVMAAVAIASAIQKGIQAHKQNKLANEIKPDDPTYEPSDYAKANLGLASSLFNGRMAGAADAERNIQAAQANTLGQVNRNATSSSQALALAAASQGQANDSYGRLATAEAQNKYGLAGQLFQANRDMTGENNKVYQDMIRKHGNDVQAKTALRQASANNVSGIFSDLSSAAFAGASMQGGGVGGPGAYSTMPYANSSGGIQSNQWASAPNVNANNFAYPGQGSMTPNNLPMYFNSLTGRWQSR